VIRNGLHKYFEFLFNLPLGSWKDELIDNLLEYYNLKLRNGLLPSRYENYDNGDFHLLFLRIKCEQYAKELLSEKERIVIKRIENVLIEFKKGFLSSFWSKITL